MRQLITNDVFKMSKILKKLNLNFDFNIDSKDKNWDEKFGVEIIKKIAENAHLAQNEINDFLGELAGITGDEFGKLPIKDAIKIINEFKNLDGINDFFKSAGQLTQ